MKNGREFVYIFIETSKSIRCDYFSIRFDLIERLFIGRLDILDTDIGLCVNGISQHFQLHIFLLTWSEQQRSVELEVYLEFVVWPWGSISVNLQLIFFSSSSCSFVLCPHFFGFINTTMSIVMAYYDLSLNEYAIPYRASRPIIYKFYTIPIHSNQFCNDDDFMQFIGPFFFSCVAFHFLLSFHFSQFRFGYG